MRNLLILILLSYSSLTLSQEKIQLVTGLSGSFSKEVLSNYNSQEYGGIGFDFGARFHQKKSDLDISIVYQFSSNMFYDYAFDSINNQGKPVDSDGNSINAYKSLLRSHFVGGTLKYIFREREKRFRPFIKISALTEISTNYKNGYLMDYELIPKEEPSKYSYYTSPGYKVSYYSYLYQSTPFVGSFQIGCDIRLIKDLHLNLSLGYGLRYMKTKYVEWKENEDFHEKLNSIPIEKHISNMLDIQLGLSYAFSFHKKEKAQPEKKTNY